MEYNLVVFYFPFILLTTVLYRRIFLELNRGEIVEFFYQCNNKDKKNRLQAISRIKLRLLPPAFIVYVQIEEA